ncbi:hypothetical protein CQW23_22583 [Capsicum baccatum]|uniref:Uncharacterized protein n=1 Tax=Capsicum baccatum TaxID=33114 RepID=A0A2G2W199_CAPBA|nr:hypothetical protein CQW23_22583 [Capsicum baccatum]
MLISLLMENQSKGISLKGLSTLQVVVVSSMEDKKSIRLCMPQLEAIDDMIFTCVVAIELIACLDGGFPWYGMVWLPWEPCLFPWYSKNDGIVCNLPAASTTAKARLLLKAQEKKNNGETFLCNNKDGVPQEVQGKWHCSVTIDVNIGANPSATYMGEDQGIENSTNKVVYIIDSLNIQEQLSSEIRSLLGIKKYIQNSATKFDSKKQEISKNIE